MPGFGQGLGTVLSQMGPGLLSGVGKLLEGDGKEQQPPTGPNAAHPNSFDKGGKVEKTGLALVHKGEKVIPVTHQHHNVSLYRAIHHMNHGGLHRALGVPEDETIPHSKLEAAKNSENEHVRHMANFASTLEGMHH